MAKVFDNLYKDIVDFSNLYQAWRKAAKGKRKSMAVASFEMNLSDELICLQNELKNRTWQAGQYQSFTIRDPKKRLVSAAPFRDRVVHHALCNVTESIYENTFIGDSFANRKGKGTHAALDKAQVYMRRFPYVLQCDLKQFFPSVDHAVMESVLNRKIIDVDTRWLMRSILKSGEGIHPSVGVFNGNKPHGLPIGNLTSQFWANVLLNELDQFVKRNLGCKGYLRYVDDFLLFSDSKKELWEWKLAISAKLKKLKLQMHQQSSTVYPVATGVPFLGFRLYPNHRRLKRKNGVNFQRRLQRYYGEYQRSDLSREALNMRVQGWVAHASKADTWGLRRSLLSASLPLRVL